MAEYSMYDGGEYMSNEELLNCNFDEVISGESTLVI